MNLVKVATFLATVKEIEVASGRVNNQAQVSDTQCEVNFFASLTIPYTVKLTFVCNKNTESGHWLARLFRGKDSAAMDVGFPDTEQNLEDIKSIVIDWVKGNTIFNREVY